MFLWVRNPAPSPPLSPPSLCTHLCPPLFRHLPLPSTLHPSLVLWPTDLQLRQILLPLARRGRVGRRGLSEPLKSLLRSPRPQCPSSCPLWPNEGRTVHGELCVRALSRAEFCPCTVWLIWPWRDHRCLSFSFFLFYHSRFIPYLVTVSCLVKFYSGIAIEWAYSWLIHNKWCLLWYNACFGDIDCPLLCVSRFWLCHWSYTDSIVNIVFFKLIQQSLLLLSLLFCKFLLTKQSKITHTYHTWHTWLYMFAHTCV